jgi:hypothetical protein
MDKRAGTDVAALALPGLHQKCPSLQVAKGHPKAGGRDFQPGQNSHDGTIPRRDPDQLPPGQHDPVLQVRLLRRARADLPAGPEDHRQGQRPGRFERSSRPVPRQKVIRVARALSGSLPTGSDRRVVRTEGLS